MDINSQKLVYDQISWENSREIDAAEIQTLNVRGHPGGNSGDEYWEFDVEVDHNKGLIFKNLVIKDRTNTTKPQNHEQDATTHEQDATTHEQVATAIEFREMRVVYKDEAGNEITRMLDLSSAFQTGEISLNEGIIGSSKFFYYLRTNDLWQRGFKLRAKVNIDNKVIVTIEQSIALKGAEVFDPATAVIAMKVFPQVSFSWSPAIDNNGEEIENVEVISFHGAVWQNINPLSSIHQMGMPGQRSKPSANVFTSWFSEMNHVANLIYLPFRLKRDLSLSESLNPQLLFWVYAFTYYYEQTQCEMEIVGVRHIDDSKDNNGNPIARDKSYDWYAPSGNAMNWKVRVKRDARAGQYDNLHNHGWMGWTEVPDSNPPTFKPRLMAPVCAEACIHLHWRWFGLATYNPQNWRGYNAAFYGWGDDPKTATAKSEPDKPMVPPNQRVRIAVTKSDTVHNGTSVLPNTSNLKGVKIPFTQTKDAQENDVWENSRALWYDVDIIGYIKRDAPQVLLENGWGYALRHNDYGVADVLNRHAAFKVTGHRMNSFHEAMMVLYDDWRYYTTGKEQIPDGTHNIINGNADPTKMEDV